MSKIQMQPKEVFKWIIVGIENGNYEAAKNLALDAVKQMEEHEKEKENGTD